jgi:hypothetical protein
MWPLLEIVELVLDRNPSLDPILLTVSFPS